MSKNSYLDEPADIRAEPGTKVWARGVAAKIKYSASKLEFDVSSVQEWIQIAVEHDAWKVLGYVSLDGFLVSEASITQEFIDAIRNAKKGTKIGDVKAQIAEAKAKPLLDVGPPTKEERGNLCNTNNTKGGTVDYTLRRLARDAPEYLDKIEAGELSVNAAAIAAGIRKKPTPEDICIKAFGKAQDRLKTLKAIIDTLEPYEAATVRDWVLERLH